jgi:hypothetical protein
MNEAKPELLSCLNCRFKTDNESEFERHSINHEHEVNFRLKCYYCIQIFSTLKYHRKHVKDCKPNAKSSSPIEDTNQANTIRDECAIWQCKNCDETIEVKEVPNQIDFEAVITHMYKHAKNDEIVDCPVCAGTFDNYNSFTTHCNRHRRKRKFNLGVQATTLTSEPTDNVNDSILPYIENDALGDNGNQVSVPNPVLEIRQDAANNQETSTFTPTSYSLNSTIEKKESLFALKLQSKHLLPREVINDILTYCGDVHSLKMECITSHLKENFGIEESVEIDKIINAVDVHDSVVGLQDKLLTDYKRDRYLKATYEFIEPKRIPIYDDENIEVSFYYSTPIRESLTRLLKDESLRRDE